MCFHIMHIVYRSANIASRLEQEIQIMHRLNHENIIRVYDVFRESWTITLILEHAKYGDLMGQMRQNRFGLRQTKVRWYQRLKMTCIYV